MEKPKDLRLLLRRTQSGVSLTEKSDTEKRTDARPQLRGSAPALTPEVVGGESRAQLRGPCLSPRSARENTPSKEPLRRPPTETEQGSMEEKDKKTNERPQLRRTTSTLGGGDREDEGDKKNPRLQFRRTVSAPSLNVPRERKRLIHCAGKKRIHVRETDPVAGSLNNHDVYGAHGAART